MADVIVGSRTHELRVFTGSAEDAREFAAGLVEQLTLQGPGSPNPGDEALWQWTPENWREGLNDTAGRIRLGVTSCTWTGPAGLEIRIEDARTGVSAESPESDDGPFIVDETATVTGGTRLGRRPHSPAAARSSTSTATEASGGAGEAQEG